MARFFCIFHALSFELHFLFRPEVPFKSIFLFANIIFPRFVGLWVFRLLSKHCLLYFM